MHNSKRLDSRLRGLDDMSSLGLEFDSRNRTARRTRITPHTGLSPRNSIAPSVDFIEEGWIGTTHTMSSSSPVIISPPADIQCYGGVPNNVLSIGAFLRELVPSDEFHLISDTERVPYWENTEHIAIALLDEARLMFSTVQMSTHLSMPLLLTTLPKGPDKEPLKQVLRWLATQQGRQWEEGRQGETHPKLHLYTVPVESKG